MKSTQKIKSTGIIGLAIVVLCIQLMVYLLFFRSHILKWGATDSEVTMPMQGDKYAEVISSTRAIDINKPAADVWACLVDLGADRKGFYSFNFLEYLYGCETVKQINSENREFQIGRLIPTTKPDSDGNYKEGFHVIDVVQGQSFVLKDWGEFLVKKIDAGNSRLIIRTHYKSPHNAIGKLGYSIFDMLHYIMEKRMMLGIKDSAESNGENYNDASDLIWFLCIFFSGIAGLLMVFIFQGYSRITIPTIFFTVWQFALLVLDPKPIYGIALLVIIGASVFLYQTFLKNKKQHI
jgi:hypothetical protein